jgi:hypothetical protein
MEDAVGYDYLDDADEASKTITTNSISVSIPSQQFYGAGSDTGTSSSVYAAMPDKKKVRCYTKEHNERLDTSLSCQSTEEWAAPQRHFTDYHK